MGRCELFSIISDQRETRMNHTAGDLISEYSFSSFVNPPIGSTTVLAAHDHFFRGKAMQKTWINRSTSAKVWDTTWDQRFLPFLPKRRWIDMADPWIIRCFYRDPYWQIMFSIPPAQWPSHVPWSIYIFGPWVTPYPILSPGCDDL